MVTRATYCALWWPPIDTVRYDAARGDQLPAWDREIGRYVDPQNGQLLSTWDEALDAVESDESAQPMHVVSFGRQVDIKGIIGGTEQTRRAVGYLCKYITKAVAETYVDPEHPDPAYEAHIDRLHAEVRWLPCSETCANWIRFGVAPKDPGPGLIPGMCPSKTHDRECLGLGGRRVLVSRHWTGKTLSEHRVDRAAVVRAVLEEAGIEPPEARRMAADVLHVDGRPRYVWDDLPTDERAYARTIASSIQQRLAWREQYERAKEMVRAGPAA